MAALNLVLIALLEFQDRELFAAAVPDDFAADGGAGGVGTEQNLFLAIMHGKNRAKCDLFSYLAIHLFDADGVAGRDTILLSPGLDYGVHLSSKSSTQTIIIRVIWGERQRK